MVHRQECAGKQLCVQGYPQCHYGTIANHVLFMITIFQHGRGEPPGYVLEIIKQKRLEYEIIRLFAGDQVPERMTSSHYIVLGGLMSVNDGERYPWITVEKRFIRDAIRSGVPVLGICLGAQLIASSFSCEVRRCTEEKGWTVIRSPETDGPGTCGREVTVFEWHGECFDLPEKASLILTGNVVPNQMFTLGSATGVQFHPEVDEAIIRQWIAAEPRNLQETVLRAIPACLGPSMILCGEIMDQFIRKGV